MRDLVAATRPDLLQAVCGLVGEDPFHRVDESTRYAQPAIFCASMASWTRLADRVAPVAMAGHSLGELSALAAADGLDELDALRLVVLRADLMARSGQANGNGTMLAVVGGTPARGAALASRHGVVVANDNAPDQVVLSGASAELEGAGAPEYRLAGGGRFPFIAYGCGRGAIPCSACRGRVSPARGSGAVVHKHTCVRGSRRRAGKR